MYTFEQIAEILDDIVDTIPDVLLEKLNGIYLEPDTKHNDKIPSDSYYVMGTFFNEGYLGHRIEIYYGSIMAMYGSADIETLTTELRHIVSHELRHHVETLAGCDDLVKEDDEFIERALEKLKRQNGGAS